MARRNIADAPHLLIVDDDDRIRELIKRYLAREGFRITTAQLQQLRRPVIVFVQSRGYPHFTVLKGVRGDRAFLADPSLGNVRMPLYRFLAMWADSEARGIVFAVEPKGGSEWPASSALDVRERTVNLEARTARQLFDTASPSQGDHGIH